MSHSYKVYLVRELWEDDFDRRTHFCEQVLGICNEFLNFFKTFFSDKATFCLSGTVNSQNCRHWVTENWHWMQEAPTEN